MCRICLDGDDKDNPQNPLITPCSWSGSMKHVHLEWLQTWTNSHRRKREGEYVRSYHWKKLQCELWKQNLETEFGINGQVHKLLEYKEIVQDNYFILESFSSTPSRTLHLIEIPNEKVKKKNKKIELLLGRVSTLDIRITDASVSRVHSKITYFDGNFYIKDLDSKFGTLVWLRYPIPIPNKIGYSIACQVNEAYFEIRPKFNLCKYWCPRRKNKITPDPKAYLKNLEFIPTSFKCYLEMLDEFVADKVQKKTVNLEIIQNEVIVEEDHGKQF